MLCTACGCSEGQATVEGHAHSHETYLSKSVSVPCVTYLLFLALLVGKESVINVWYLFIQLKNAVDNLNNRPRKTRGYQTPDQIFNNVFVPII